MAAPDRIASKPALTLAERPLSLVQLMARKGRVEALAAAVKAGLGLDLPPPGKWAAGAGADAIWIQPGGWLLMAEPAPPGAFRAKVAAAAGDLGAAVDQSSGRSVIRLGGARALRARYLLPPRPPSARLRAGLGCDDAGWACDLHDPSRRRNAELRPHRRLHLCTLADRGAARGLACAWRPLRPRAGALGNARPAPGAANDLASPQSRLRLPDAGDPLRLRSAGGSRRRGAADLHDLDLRFSRRRRRQCGHRQRGARLPLWARTQSDPGSARAPDRRSRGRGGGRRHGLGHGRDRLAVPVADEPGRRDHRP